MVEGRVEEEANGVSRGAVLLFGHFSRSTGSRSWVKSKDLRTVSLTPCTLRVLLTHYHECMNGNSIVDFGLSRNIYTLHVPMVDFQFHSIFDEKQRFNDMRA